jgi:D-lactate dehydrogenase
MAPYVEMEWGRQATDLMRRIKHLFDPAGLLNPGVILNPDPHIHLKNFKPMAAADPIVDRCTECGFCEPMCPTRGLTVTPRQRIVGAREAARVAGTNRAARLERAFLDFSIASCAACGLCETVCPVGINTGSMSKAIRGRHQGAFARGVAGLASRHYGTALGLVRAGLRAASAFDAVTAGYGLDAAGALMRGVLGNSAPLLSHRATPRAGARIKSKPAAESDKPRAIYWDERPGEPVSAALYRLAEKAGVAIVTPQRAAHLCCGQPFDSKGLFAEANRKAEEAIGALLTASEGGTWPVFSDTSPCSQRLKTVAAGRLPLLDIAEFLHDHVLPNVDVPGRVMEPVALHLTCSAQRMGLGDKLLTVAQACAEQVIIPPGIGCCAFAGDKGFVWPEMNAHALRGLAPAIKGCRAGYSTSRTCEIGLTVHGGVPYRSIAHLLDQVARPRNAEATTPDRSEPRSATDRSPRA